MNTTHAHQHGIDQRRRYYHGVDSQRVITSAGYGLLIACLVCLGAIAIAAPVLYFLALSVL